MLRIFHNKELHFLKQIKALQLKETPENSILSALAYNFQTNKNVGNIYQDINMYFLPSSHRNSSLATARGPGS